MKPLIVSLSVRVKGVFLVDIETRMITFRSYFNLHVAHIRLDPSVIIVIGNSCIIL